MGVVSKFDLLLSLGESLGPEKEPAGIRGTFEYSTDLFDPETADSIVGTVRSDRRGVRAIPMHRCAGSQYSNAPSQKLLEGFNATACPVPETTLPQLFEAQAGRTPGHRGVFGDQELSTPN